MKRSLGRTIAALVLVFAAVLASGCAGDFATRRVDPLRSAKSKFTEAREESLVAGVREQRAGNSEEAAVFYLRTIERLALEPTSLTTEEARRFALARLIEICAPRFLAGAKSLEFDSTAPGTRHYHVVLRKGPGRGGVEPSRFEQLKAADRYAVSRVSVMSGRPGTGAPLVGRLTPIAPFRQHDESARPISGLNWAVTAVALVGPGHGATREIALELYEPHDTATVALSPNEKQKPLAADYTTPLAVSHTDLKGRRLGLAGFFRGDSYFSNAGLYFLERPSTEKTPVVLVHGLISDPGAFRYLANALTSDREISRRYQIWVFFYPTGLPVPASAELLRSSLAQKIRTLDPTHSHPALHHVVLVGHSMGGMITRLLASDSDGDNFYRHYFLRSLDQLTVSKASRSQLRRVFFFHPSPDVGSVIFIATPHRGSSLAVSPLGFLGRLLVSLPKVMRAHLVELATNNEGAIAHPGLTGESSVFGLSPRSPLVRATASAPLAANQVRFYSIIGNRGRRGPIEKSSDGVVPYTSSHLPVARHETIVPAGHSGTLIVPQSLAEVARILRENPDR